MIPLFAVLGYARSAAAYPWMIRHGYGSCATCHADPSGGELLTKYGRAQGDLLLRMHWGKDTSSAAASTQSSGSAGSFDEFDEPGSAPAPKAKPEPKKAETEAEAEPARTGFLWGLWDTPDPLLLGGSIRAAAFFQGESARVFPMQLDLYGQLTLGPVFAGGSIGAARVKQNSPNARAAFLTTNQGNEEFNLLSRTHYVGVHLGSEFSVRAGRLNLPFGLRIPEHYAWVRDNTRTDRESDQQHGAAIAYGGKALRAEVMGIAGNYQIAPDRYRERGYSGFAEYLVSNDVGVGVSSLITAAKADRVSLEQEKTTRGVHGAFTRIHFAKPMVLMAEADAMHISRRALGYVGFAQLDYELSQGLHLIGTGEALDMGRHDAEPGGFQPEKAAGEGKARFGGWLSVDWFFLPQLELRVDAIGRQDAGGYLLAQLHAYL